VYLGRQPSLGRDVAIKILAPWFSISDERRARFEREALTASMVRHPNVVSVLSFGEQSGVCYLVMEHVAGRTLHAHLEEIRARRASGLAPDEDARLTHPEEAARIVAAVARGLEACHKAGVLHRDVKPHNILLDAELEPRVVDFGLARNVGMASLSDTGSLTGTPQYMSPEQALAQGDAVDHRSDVYSAGAVLYELLTLKPPVEGTDIGRILREIVDGKTPHLRVLAPDVPRPLATICMRALSKDVGTRYQSAAELADDLQRFRAGRPILPGLRWVVRERLATILHDHPWAVPAAAAVLLLSLEPSAGTNVEAAEDPGRMPKWSTGDSEAGIDPVPDSAVDRRIDELMELLPDTPIYRDEDG
jgi:serine/threonine protein kinase